MQPIAENSEAFVLGKIITDQARNWQLAVEAGLCSEHFGNEEHRALWQLLENRVKRGFTVTPSALADADGAVANPKVMSRVLESVMIEGLFADHMAILRDRLARRILREASVNTADLNAEATIAELQDALRRAGDHLAQDRAVVSLKDALRELMAEQLALISENRLAGIATGYEELDSISGGMRPGQFWVIAGRASEGKSVMMLQIALEAAKAGKRVVIVSLEMSRHDVAARLLSCSGRIQMPAVTSIEKATAYERSRITAETEELLKLDVHLIDTSDLTIDKIAAISTRLNETKHIDLLVIDYLQLVVAPHIKGQSREGEVASISRACKNLARRLQCPVLTGSQLNEDGKTRESRAIAQDCDVLLAIKDGGKEPGVKVRKMRNGERGRILDLTLNGIYQKFD